MTITENNWKDKKLKNHYIYLHKYHNDYLFNFKFGSYFSSKVMLKYLKRFPNYNILEIGIGAGNFFRYLKINNCKNSYTGADISDNYVQLAKDLHKSNCFILTDHIAKTNLDTKYDIVYSRNVALHQSNPYDFIENLLKKTKKILILELKTRDNGKTKYDTNNSCQLIDGAWVPYIVLNYNELKEFLKRKLKLINAKIYLNREYTILGGKNSRYLDKELYLKETKGANTTIILEIDKNENPIENNHPKQEIFETFKNDTQLKKNLFYYFFATLNKLKNVIKYR